MRPVFAMLALATLAGAAPPSKPALAPTAKWVVDFDAAQCMASRNYGTADDPLLLALKQPAIGDVIQLYVIRRGGGSAPFAVQFDGKIALDGAELSKRSMLNFSGKATRQRVLLLNMPLAEFAAVRTAKTLTIDAGSRLDETFELKDVEKLMKVMDHCVADLRSAWNVVDPPPPNRPAGAAAPPTPLSPKLLKGPIGGVPVFKADDYPDVALDKDGEGTVAFALLIDEQGKVADCTVTKTSGLASLDAQSCAIVKQRARFEPAIGLDGKPAKSSWHQRVTWRID